MGKIVVVTSLLLVGACASPTIWDKSGATQADFNKDSYECQKDAYAAGGAQYVGYGATRRTVNVPMYNNCMVAHGYTARAKG
jgi:hypothetical protein